MTATTDKLEKGKRIAGTDRDQAARELTETAAGLRRAFLGRRIHQTIEGKQAVRCKSGACYFSRPAKRHWRSTWPMRTKS